jgi:hypothetical protein
MAAQAVLDEVRFSMTVEDSVRPAALAIAIALHASLLLLTQPRMRSNDVSAVSIWLDLDAREGSEQERVLPPREQKPSTHAEAAPAQQSITASAPDIAPPSATSEWTLSGAIAAQAAIDEFVRREGYRPLGPQAKQSQAPVDPPSIYSTPEHKLGDAEPDPLNYDIVWHSDRCYTELGKPVTPRVDARTGFPNVRKCRLIDIGKKKARGDLFEHLK